jgi:hypothetical protein
VFKVEKIATSENPSYNAGEPITGAWGDSKRTAKYFMSYAAARKEAHAATKTAQKFADNGHGFNFYGRVTEVGTDDILDRLSEQVTQELTEINGRDITLDGDGNATLTVQVTLNVEEL